MVIKLDKSQEFIKSGKKLISEYDADGLLRRKRGGKTSISEGRGINKLIIQKPL